MRNEATAAEVRKEFTKHMSQYPGVQCTPVMIDAWCEELGDLIPESIRPAFERARKASQTFAPTCPQIRTLAEEEAKVIIRARAEKRAERMLPPPSQNRDAALQSFYRACDQALSRVGQHEIEEVDKPTIVGLVVLMLRTYGCTDPGVTPLDTLEQFGKWVIAHFGKNDPNGCHGLNVAPDVLVRGLRKVPSQCPISPTIGMLEEVVRGESLDGYRFAFKQQHTGDQT